MDTTMLGGRQAACFERIMDLVAGSGVAFTLHTHQATRTMAEAEENLDFDTSRIVKTIAFASRDGGLILAALRGTRRVSYPALAGLFGLKRRDLAALSPEDVLARLGVAPGSVSPLLPCPAGTALVIDTDVLAIAPTLYCGTGRPDRTLELAPADLVRIAGGRMAPFSRSSHTAGPMFVVILTYVGSLDAVDALLPAHNRFLRENYDKGVFLLSGPQVPRQGGVILARAESREALLDILAADPFGREGVARYEVIEFVAKMGAPECAGLVRQA